MTTTAQQPGDTRTCEHIKHASTTPPPACMTGVTQNTAQRPAWYDRGNNKAPPPYREVTAAAGCWVGGVEAAANDAEDGPQQPAGESGEGGGRGGEKQGKGGSTEEATAGEGQWGAAVGEVDTAACEVAVFGSCRSVPTWCFVCGVHPPAPDRVCVGTLLPACLVLRPCVVAPPTDRVRFCPGALACA